MLFENLMFLNVSGIQSAFLISGSDASAGPVKMSDVQFVDAPMKPSKSVANVLLRLRSTPQPFLPAGSLLVAPGIGRPVDWFTDGVQKLAANGSSVSLPPTTQWFVMLRRCCEKLWI